jgi:hypothetical protein
MKFDRKSAKSFFGLALRLRKRNQNVQSFASGFSAVVEVGDRFGEGREFFLGGWQIIFPKLGVTGPRKPDGFMRLPFRRLTKPEAFGCWLNGRWRVVLGHRRLPFFKAVSQN